MCVRVLLLWLLLGMAPAMACAPPAPGTTEPDASALVVVEPKLDLATRGDERLLVTLVSLKNMASVCLDDIVIEVRYFNAAKQLIDSKTENFSGIVVPPGKTVAFRLDSKPVQSQESYTAQEVTVVSASPAYSSRRPAPAGIGNLLVEWLPFTFYVLLMIGLVLWLRSKKSPQSRGLVLSEQQNVLLQAQNRQLERIAEALERRGHDRGGAQ